MDMYKVCQEGKLPPSNTSKNVEYEGVLEIILLIPIDLLRE